MSPRGIFLAGIALCAIWGVKAVARKPQEPNQPAVVSLSDSAAVDIADEDVPYHRNGTRRAVRLPRTQNIFQSVKLTLIVDRKRHADRRQVIHMLARAGADLDAQDEEGNTALHGAYSENVAKALIEEGADVNIRNNDGNTPLMKNFSVEAAKLLVAAGADVHAKNHEGKTALDFARQLEPEGERVKFLLSVESAKAGRP